MVIGRLGAAGRGVGCRFPAPDLGTDRRDGRRNDSQVFLQPAQRDGEPLCMSSAKVVRGWVWLRREVFDPDDFLCVRIGQRRGSRPATAVPRAPPNVVVALAGHGANDTRGGTPFQASWRWSVAADQPISLSYPTDLLPKAVLIFGCRQDQIRPDRIGLDERTPKQRDHRSDGLLPAPLSTFRAPRAGRGSTHDQKMYSRVAFGSPLLTSREYSNNLTHARTSVQGIHEKW